MANLFMITIIALIFSSNCAFGQTKDLTNEDKETLNKLREQLLIEGIKNGTESKEFVQKWLKETTDEFLHKWIQSDEMNLNQTVDSILNSLIWRRINNIEKLIDFKPPFDPKDFPFNFTGFSKEGEPVVYAEVGKWDIRSMVATGQRKELFKFIISKIELAIKEIKKSNATRLILICDLNEFSLAQVASIRTLNFMVTIVATIERNYPQHSKYIIINAPTFIDVLSKALSGVVKKKTVAQTQVFGTDKKEWKKAIHELIPLSAIPEPLQDIE